MPAPRDSIDLDRDYDPADYEREPDEIEAPEVDEPEVERRPRGRIVNRTNGSRIPAHAPKPQDRKPPKKTAAQREAEGIETAEVEFDDVIYSIPVDPVDWPLDATEAFEQGKAITAIRGLLGEKQWRVVRSKGYRNKDFNELFNLLAKAGGFSSAGN
ncbi:hypothetical protein C5E45_33005 [Nocardia nova]|uniref:Tail assembly chaperone n=1 Tax=Nocardia nova TaxID=37330 RepID=A0A2S6ACT1_9NOCA|nr:hypothetical protein [Nocardia nova]PPJ31912.1 hypothetical protein C5E45_33005 [Nocardia nova]